MGAIENSIINFVDTYKSFVQTLPLQLQIFINLFLLTILVVIYTVFIWRGYIFISTKNILRLNLNKYNTSSHPIKIKFIATSLYFLEYIIILPILIFFWFLFFTFLLLFITNDLKPSDIVLVSAITIASVRMASYWPKYGEAVSSEIARIIPLTLLAFSITTPGFFKLGDIINQLSKFPQVFNQIWLYFFFIVALELILRGFSFVISLFQSGSGEDDEEEKDENDLKKEFSKKKV